MKTGDVLTRFDSYPENSPACIKTVIYFYLCGIESVGYRLKRSWNTTNTPLGHNEVHTLAVVTVDGQDVSEIQFAPVGGGQEYFAGPTGISADVKNLVITDVTTNSGKPDYFKFDPDSEDSTFKNPKLSFKIEDSGDPHQYKWEVKIRSTSNEDREWTVFCRGEVLGAQQVSINLNDPSAPNIAPNLIFLTREPHQRLV